MRIKKSLSHHQFPVKIFYEYYRHTDQQTDNPSSIGPIGPKNDYLFSLRSSITRMAPLR